MIWTKILCITFSLTKSLILRNRTIWFLWCKNSAYRIMTIFRIILWSHSDPHLTSSLNGTLEVTFHRHTKGQAFLIVVLNFPKRLARRLLNFLKYRSFKMVVSLRLKKCNYCQEIINRRDSFELLESSISGREGTNMFAKILKQWWFSLKIRLKWFESKLHFETLSPFFLTLIEFYVWLIQYESIRIKIVWMIIFVAKSKYYSAVQSLHLNCICRSMIVWLHERHRSSLRPILLIFSFLDKTMLRWKDVKKIAVAASHARKTIIGLCVRIADDQSNHK